MRHAPVRLALAVAAITLSAATSPLLAQATTAPAAPAAAPDSARLALARDLLALMRAGPAMLQGLEMGLSSQKAASPQLPEAFWTEFSARARRELPRFVESIVPVYARRFTTQELQQLVAFYRTPTGRHLAEEGAAISAEVIRAGQRWGVEIGADTAKELAAKGIILQ